MGKGIEVNIKGHNGPSTTKLDQYMLGYTAAIEDLKLILEERWYSVNCDSELLVRYMIEERDRRVVDRS